MRCDAHGFVGSSERFDDLDVAPITVPRHAGIQAALANGIPLAEVAAQEGVPEWRWPVARANGIWGAAGRRPRIAAARAQRVGYAPCVAQTAEREEQVAVRVVQDIGEIDAAAWDACAGKRDPFVRHAFLLALEQSGSAVAREGWLPQHLVIEQGDGIAAAAPLYVKGHSYGEYVFDWSWAGAYKRHGLRYYPKLQCCVPFSPVTGRRLLVPPDSPNAEALSRTLVAAMIELARVHDCSGVHITFATEAEWKLCGDSGMLQRTGLQYHWHNQGYQCFDDFLQALLGRKRKAIRQERRRAAASGCALRVLRGDDIKPAHWDAFHRFYLSTIDRKWASAYLTRAFFHLIGETMADNIVLMMAFDGDEPVAGALNLLGEDALYGRYWGSDGDHPDLHFEACYYRAIELAIELGLSRVEAGAQGQHKIQRGYLPATTYSAHWLAHPEFRHAIGDFLEREREAVALERRELMAHSPFAADRAMCQTPRP